MKSMLIMIFFMFLATSALGQTRVGYKQVDSNEYPKIHRAAEKIHTELRNREILKVEQHLQILKPAKTWTKKELKKKLRKISKCLNAPNNIRSDFTYSITYVPNNILYNHYKKKNSAPIEYVALSLTDTNLRSKYFGDSVSIVFRLLSYKKKNKNYDGKFKLEDITYHNKKLIFRKYELQREHEVHPTIRMEKKLIVKTPLLVGTWGLKKIEAVYLDSLSRVDTIWPMEMKTYYEFMQLNFRNGKSGTFRSEDNWIKRYAKKNKRLQVKRFIHYTHLIRNNIIELRNSTKRGSYFSSFYVIEKLTKENLVLLDYNESRNVKRERIRLYFQKEKEKMYSAEVFLGEQKSMLQPTLPDSVLRSSLKSKKYYLVQGNPHLPVIYSGFVYEVRADTVFPNGQMVKGEKNGMWRFWKNDFLYEGKYIAGQEDGTHFKLNSKGQKVTETTYRNGKVDGPSRSWHEDGALSTERIYKEGKSVKYTVFDTKGEKMLKYSNQSDAAKAEVFTSRKDAILLEELQNTSEGYMKNGVPFTGIAITYFNGRMNNMTKEYTIEKGIFHGSYKEILHNGKLFMKGTYHEGQKHGRWQEWHTNQKRKLVENYNKGKKDGQFSTWSAWGYLLEEKSFNNDLKHGRFRKWEKASKKGKEGPLLVDGSWDNGEKDGVWTYWYGAKKKNHLNGKLLKKELYKNGKPVGHWVELKICGSTLHNSACSLPRIEKQWLKSTSGKDLVLTTNYFASGQLYSWGIHDPSTGDLVAKKWKWNGEVMSEKFIQNHKKVTPEEYNGKFGQKFFDEWQNTNKSSSEYNKIIVAGKIIDLNHAIFQKPINNPQMDRPMSSLDLLFRDNIHYMLIDDLPPTFKPFTGKVNEYGTYGYRSKYPLMKTGEMLNGKKDGRWKHVNERDKSKPDIYYRNGIKVINLPKKSEGLDAVYMIRKAENILKENFSADQITNWKIKLFDRGITDYVIYYQMTIPGFGQHRINVEFDANGKYKGTLDQWLLNCLFINDTCLFMPKEEACKIAVSVCDVIKEGRNCKNSAGVMQYDKETRSFRYKFDFNTASRELEYGNSKETIKANVHIDAITGEVLWKECSVK